MFTLINGMETTIKINTSIIFRNKSHLTGEEVQLLRRGAYSFMKGKKSLPHTRKGVKSITFCGAGASREPLLFYSTLAAFKSDTTQASSSIHTLVAVYNAKYLCGNIITVQIYWQWQQGIRASLCVPQDERAFHSLAPEVLRGMDCVTSWQRPKLHAGDNERRADSTRGKDERKTWGNVPKRLQLRQ